MRLLVGAAAVVTGVVIGAIVISMAGGGNERPVAYRPLQAGPAELVIDQVEEDGPVFLRDPTGGDRSFFLDLEDGDIVALFFVPEGGSTECPVDYDEQAERYEDCDGNPVRRDQLLRYPVTLQGTQDIVTVDLRRLVPK